ncbi:putative MATE family efflux protein [Hydrogenoanaerobacterium saccharovorans]|uniref:Probable multidrug resistance protein NorM n=1 Tax=Hydrogenoanaerobacterium saccharovorans TaxID=474960 RepID=A0A1H8A273_9FIRM|nr:MATE family efflux transporter [Hydrogenoanaerobacterium saccharovorans]RPF48199.1 putative MATE family efflux protein [Hydrogenoanaerobacterium saccharovorans]SEM65012.1 putative efflux protein, MATE family [Hydrogenoanaerobacterium saccharovorans]
MAAAVIDKKFYTAIYTIAMPIALQNIISFSVNLMDTVMLGKLGEIALSASSLANQMFFIFNVVCFGVASGAIVLASQYWGKRDSVAIQKITGLAVKIIIGFSVLFTIIVVAFPTQIMSIFSPDREVIEAGARYLRVVAFSYTTGGISATFLMILRSVETVKISVLIYSISFCVNVFFNYIFIFGKFGAPVMGVTGAAVGTVIARVTECIVLVFYLKFFEKKIQYKLRTLLSFDKDLMQDLIRYGMPVMINEFLWAVGVSVHSVILGHISASVVAANSICNVVYQLATSFIFGVGSATAVITGNIIGSGDIPYLQSCVKKFKKLYFFLGVASALLLILLKKPVLSIYNIEPQTLDFANQLMVAYAFAIFFMAYTCPLITGIFRGSGDTRFAALVDIGCLWCVIPIGAVAAFVFHLPPLIVFACLKMDYPLKTMFCLLRLRGTNWIRSVTR